MFIQTTLQKTGRTLIKTEQTSSNAWQLILHVKVVSALCLAADIPCQGCDCVALSCQ